MIKSKLLELFSVREYLRRIDELKKDGYRLSYDSSFSPYLSVWCAYLVHHNGNKVRLKCDWKKNSITQTTNNVVTYEWNDKEVR